LPLELTEAKSFESSEILPCKDFFDGKTLTQKLLPVKRGILRQFKIKDDREHLQLGRDPLDFAGLVSN
jgi:hypothetical protein